MGDPDDATGLEIDVPVADDLMACGRNCFGPSTNRMREYNVSNVSFLRSMFHMLRITSFPESLSVQELQA